MVNWVALGAVAIVIVLLILGALERWNVFSDDRENPDSGTERVRQEARREGDYNVSWLQTHKTLTLPAKVVMICMGLIVISTGVYVYFVLKNGAPVEVPYANAIKAGAVGIVGVVAGVGYRGVKEGQRGRVDIIYEDEDGGEKDSERIWFDPAETTTNTDGNTVVHEHFQSRIFGLFGRRKLVAHDRELRAGRAILGDIVAHEIPDHAVKIGESHYVIRTQGQRVKSGPSTAADYYYRSPIELPYQTYLQQRERTEKLEMRIETKDAKLGEAQAQLRDLRRRLETQEYRSVEDAREESKRRSRRSRLGTTRSKCGVISHESACRGLSATLIDIPRMDRRLMPDASRRPHPTACGRAHDRRPGHWCAR